jgi:glycosyltransferase involved in cell wall biosynthesis
VPVYNDADNLKKCLHSIRMQRYETFEVLVIDDASTDETPDIAREICACDERIRSLILCERVSRGKVRRLGVSKARGRVLAFTDSDCTADAGWLETLLEPILRGPSDVAIGPDYIDRTGTIWSRAKADSVRPYRGVDTRNLAARRETLLSIGNFDERLGNLDPGKPIFGADESAELALRMRRRGLAFSRTSAIVRHAFPQGFTRNLEKAVHFGRGAYHIRRLSGNGFLDDRTVIAGFLRESRRSLSLLKEPISVDRVVLALLFRVAFFWIYYLSMLAENQDWLRQRGRLR